MTDPNIAVDAAAAAPTAVAAPAVAPEPATASPARESVLSRGMRQVRWWLQQPNTPLIVGAVALATVVGFAAARWSPLASKRADVVVFDPVKFLNAQRAAASILVTNPSADLSFTLTQVAKQAHSVIKEEAGGAVVLVKQSVVLPDDVIDITDRVIERFGLSTEVPTVTTGKTGLQSLDDIAPTDSAFSQGQLREDYKQELRDRAAKVRDAADRKTSQDKVVP